MALDGVTLSHLTKEIGPQIVGARIDKILQPEKEEIHLVLRSPGQSLRLLLNASATGARLHLTKESKKNPLTPPMFCMILRKHLEGGKISALIQDGLERIITLKIHNYNEYGDLAELHLHLEIMGKHSNLLLVDPATNTILDGLKRYSHALSRYREVLPGRPYLAPPSQGKFDPIAHEEEWREHLYKEENLERPITNTLVSLFAGISPELSRELVQRAGLEGNIRLHQCGEIDLVRLFQAYRELADPQNISKTEPCLYYEQAQALPVAFSFVLYQQYQGLETEKLPSLNEAVRLFYELRAQNNSLEAKRGSLRKIVQEYISHLAKKLDIYEDTLSSARKSLSYQKWGELLTANLYRISQGAEKVTVEDYYDENFPSVTIPLDPLLSGIENAQRYYKFYNKAKATLHKTEPLQIAATDELTYLESVLFTLEQASNPAELAEIHAELVEQEYITGKHLDRKGSKKKKGEKAKREISQPRAYLSTNGRVILVGKNNQQNDWLTLRKAKPTDLWLHVKNIPGSHVLIPLNEGEEFPDDTTLEEAAALAIYYSQTRGSSQVPVDYTHVKQIKKPNAAKPGMVIYEQNWTLFLTPKAGILDKLLATEITDNTKI